MSKIEHASMERCDVKISIQKESAEIVQVIKTTLTNHGKGTKADPVRKITQYWDLDGTLLFEIDPLNKPPRLDGWDWEPPQKSS